MGKKRSDDRLQRIGRELNGRAIRLGLTQADLCRATNIGRDSMSRYFGGQTLPGPLALTALADALRCAVRDLDPDAPDVTVTRHDAADGVPPFDVRPDAKVPGNVFFAVNHSVPAEVFGKVVAVLREHGYGVVPKDNAR